MKDNPQKNMLGDLTGQLLEWSHRIWLRSPSPDEAHAIMNPERDPQPERDLPVESDDRFPSGPWKGFFLQPILPGRQWMELILTFRKCVMTGESRDWVGRFIIRGKYELQSGKCWFAKRYVGKHDVSYQGYNEGKGIWGLWEMPSEGKSWRGGFHIWPVAMGDPTGSSLKTALELPQPEPVGEPVGVGSLEEVSASGP